MERTDPQKKDLPPFFYEKLFESSGPNKMCKGYIICTISNEGAPMIRSQFGSVMAEFAIKKALESWLEKENDAFVTDNDISNTSNESEND